SRRFCQGSIDRSASARRSEGSYQRLLRSRIDRVGRLRTARRRSAAGELSDHRRAGTGGAGRRPAKAGSPAPGPGASAPAHTRPTLDGLTPIGKVAPWKGFLSEERIPIELIFSSPAVISAGISPNA